MSRHTEGYPQTKTPLRIPGNKSVTITFGEQTEVILDGQRFTINPETNSLVPETSPPDMKNGVMAVDPATIGLAFRKFSNHVQIPLDNLRTTTEGEKLFEGLVGFSDDDFDIHDIVAAAGGNDEREGMNELAEEHGFGRPFEREFSPVEIGVLSIVDKKMKWHEGDAGKSTILLRNDEERQRVEGIEFALNSNNDKHYDVFDVNGFSKPVVRIAADPEKSDGVQNYMWVTEISPDENPSLIEVFRGVKNTVDVISQSGINVKRRGAAEVASVTIPKLSNVKYEREWKEINGTHLGGWIIKEAKQAVRVSIDETGAEAAATFIQLPEFIGGRPLDPRERITIGDTGPMLVWFTEGNSRLPICATITNPEAWQVKE